MFDMQTTVTAGIIFKLAAVVYVVGWQAIAAGLLVLTMGSAFGHLYISAQRCECHVYWSVLQLTYTPLSGQSPPKCCQVTRT